MDTLNNSTDKTDSMEKNSHVPIWEKYALTIKEASEYYGISESKLRDFLMLNIKQPFVLKGGARLLVKRKLFEEFLDGQTII